MVTTMLTQPSRLMKDLLANNAIGGIAILSVHLADALSPIPSTFWQAFALLLMNTAGTFAWRWYREWRRAKGHEHDLEKKLDDLIQTVAQLRTDFENTRKPAMRRRR